MKYERLSDVFLNNVIGHDTIKEHLSNMFNVKHYPHAFLFEGPSSVGKSYVASEVSKVFLCPTHNSDASGCVSCRKVDLKIHPDLFWLEPNAKSNILISEIREVRKRASYSPMESDKRVIVINKSDRMNFEAQNALLKILEEPPPDVFFILVTSEPQQLLATVRSRCQSVRFGLLSTEEIIQVLKQRHGFSDHQAKRFTRRLRGNLERLSRLNDPTSDLIEQRVFDDLLNARQHDLSEVNAGLAMKKEELMLYLEMLEEVFRDIYITKAGVNDQAEFLWPDRIDEIRQCADNYLTEELSEIICGIASFRDDLRRFVSPKLVYLNVIQAIGIRIFKEQAI